MSTWLWEQTPTRGRKSFGVNKLRLSLMPFPYNLTLALATVMEPGSTFDICPDCLEEMRQRGRELLEGDEESGRRSELSSAIQRSLSPRSQAMTLVETPSDISTECWPVCVRRPWPVVRSEGCARLRDVWPSGLLRDSRLTGPGPSWASLSL